MSEKKYKYHFELYPREVDYTKHLSFTALGSAILDAAGLAAVECGFSMQQMHDSGFAWVVSRLAIQMEQYPMEYQSFSIETWIENIGTLVSTRHFIIRDHADQIIGRATSLWSLIDKVKRRPTNLTERKEMFPYIDQTPIEMEPPKRVATIGTTPEPLHKVVYSDIDMNGHVNSFKYVQWILDTHPLEHFATHIVKRFDVNYSLEALFGDQIMVAHKEEADAHHYELLNGEGKAYCRMALSWHNND